jgi:hypothetical protein
MNTKINSQLTSDIYNFQLDGNWDFLEVHPVRFYQENGKDFCEQCNEGEEDFWSVYVHLENGGITCIADCKDKKSANDLKEAIYRLIGNYKPILHTILIHIVEGCVSSVFSPAPVRAVLVDVDVFEYASDESDPCFVMNAEVKPYALLPNIFAGEKKEDKIIKERLEQILFDKG